MLNDDRRAYGNIVEEKSHDPVRHADAAVRGRKSWKISLMHSNPGVGYSHKIWHWCPLEVSSRRRGGIFAYIHIVINNGSVGGFPHAIEVGCVGRLLLQDLVGANGSLEAFLATGDL